MAAAAGHTGMDFVSLPVVAPLVIFGGSLAAAFLAEKPDASTASLMAQEMDLALAQNLSTEEGKIELRRLFESIDTDSNGKVSSNEWGRAVSANKTVLARYFGGNSQAEVGAQFKRLDLDCSGDLTWEEFCSGAASMGAAIEIADTIKTQKGLDDLRQLFDVLDKDGDGRMTYHELGVAVFTNQTILKRYFGNVTVTSTPKSTAAAKETKDLKEEAERRAEEGATHATAAVEDASEAKRKADEALKDAQAAVTAKERELLQLKENLLAAETSLGAAQDNEKKAKRKQKDAAHKEVEKCRMALKTATKAVESAGAAVRSAEAAVASRVAACTTAHKAADDAATRREKAVVAFEAAFAAHVVAASIYEAERDSCEAAVQEVSKTFQRLDRGVNGSLSWEDILAAADSFTSIPTVPTDPLLQA